MTLFFSCAVGACLGEGGIRSWDMIRYECVSNAVSAVAGYVGPSCGGDPVVYSVRGCGGSRYQDSARARLCWVLGGKRALAFPRKVCLVHSPFNCPSKKIYVEDGDPPWRAIYRKSSTETRTLFPSFLRQSCPLAMSMVAYIPGKKNAVTIKGTEKKHSPQLNVQAVAPGPIMRRWLLKAALDTIPLSTFLPLVVI